MPRLVTARLLAVEDANKATAGIIEALMTPSASPFDQPLAKRAAIAAEIAPDVFQALGFTEDSDTEPGEIPLNLWPSPEEYDHLKGAVVVAVDSRVPDDVDSRAGRILVMLGVWSPPAEEDCICPPLDIPLCADLFHETLDVLREAIYGGLPEVLEAALAEAGGQPTTIETSTLGRISALASRAADQVGIYLDGPPCEPDSRRGEGAH